MGQLGWTEYEYYTSSPEAVHYAFEGYFDKEKGLIMTLRFAAYRIAESFAGTKAVGSIDSFWPVASSPKSTVEPMTKERYDLIMNRYKRK